MLKVGHYIFLQYDSVIKSDIDTDLRGSKMYLCAKFGYSGPDGL